MTSKRIWLAVILCVALSLVLFVGLLPTILSSSWGQNRLTAYVNQCMPGKVAVRSIKLSWLGSQSIEGVTLHDPEGRPIATLDTVYLESPLLRLMRAVPLHADITIKGLNATVECDAKGATNLQKALGVKAETEANPAEIPFSVQVKETSGRVKFSSLGSPIDIHLEGATLQGAQKGSFLIDAQLSGFEPDQIHALKARVKHFPVALLDQFMALSDPEWSGIVHAGLGKTLDANLEQVKAGSGIILKGSVSSATLKGQFCGSLDRNAFALTEPARVSLEVTPELARFIPSSIDVDGPIDLTIGALNIPLSHPFLSKLEAGLQFQLQNRPVKLALNLSYDKALNIVVTSNPLIYDSEGGQMSLNNLSLKINASDFQLSGQLGLPAKVAPFAGDTADLLLSGKLDSQFIPRTVDVLWKSDVAEIKFSGKQTYEGFFLTAPASIIYTPSPGMLQGSGLADLQVLKPVIATIESTKEPINLSTLHLKGLIAIDTISIGTPEMSSFAAVNQLSIPWQIDAKSNRIRLTLDGQTVLGQNSNSGRLQGNIEITDWLSSGHASFDSARVMVDLTLSPLPIAIVEALAGKPGLTALLGQSVDVQVKADWAAKNPEKSFVDVQISGQQLKGNAALTFGEMIALKEGSPLPQLSIALTPERFNALKSLMWGQASGNVSLAQTSNINITVSALSFPLNRGWLDGSISTRLSVDNLHMRDNISRQAFELGAIQGNLDSQKISKGIQFHLQAGDMLAMDGSWNKHQGALDVEGKFRSFPISLVCRAFELDRSARLKMEALLGPVIQADMSIKMQEMNGPLKLSAEGKNGRIQLDGQISQGALLLQNPFQFDVAVTPEFGQGFQDLVPLFSGILSADDRLRVTIAPKGFALPLNLSDHSSLQIGQMSIELGKMQFSNEGQFGKLLNILRKEDLDVISVWFTPIYLSAANGEITLQRFDMLLMQEYPIAAWGTIDLPDNWIEMIVGLSAKTLQKTVGAMSLDRNYMMQLPLRGPIGAAKIDRGKVAGKIASLAAQMQGTPQGLVLGTVISLATGGGLLEEQSPAPTTNPLPWETAAESGQEPQAQEENTADNPVQMLQKGANSLLRNLIR